MNKYEPDNTRIIWVDSLKVIACMFVFWGHLYQCIYYYRIDKAEFSGMAVFIVERILFFLVDASWWVYVFCILSGFFAGSKKIYSLKKLGVSVLNRYIRFFVPVLFANFIVWVFNMWVDSPIAAFSKRFNNEWIMHFEVGDKSFLDVIKATVLLNEEFIPPLWVLKYIFIGSCLVYLITYLRNKFNKYYVYTALCVMAILAGGMFIFVLESREFLIYSLLPVGGVIIRKLWSVDIWSMFNNKINHKIFSTIALFMVLCFLNVHPKWMFGIGAAFAFIFFIPYSHVAVRFLESGLFKKFSYLSFTVYLFHLLVVCSFSLYFFDRIYDPSHYLADALITYLLSTIIVLVGCFIYYVLVEKRIDIFVSNVCKRIADDGNNGRL